MRAYIFIIVCVITCTSCKAQTKPDPEIYFIPYGFIGKVNIIFGQPKGDSISYEDNKRVYYIPINGILLTRSKPEYGVVYKEYYYLDSLGNKQPLEILLNGEKDINKVGIYRNGTVGAYGSGSDFMPFQEFYVCNKKDLEGFFSKNYQKNFEQKIRELTGKSF